MKGIDPKSVIIGFLASIIIFTSLGLRPKTDELGHLVVLLAEGRVELAVARIARVEDDGAVPGG